MYTVKYFVIRMMKGIAKAEGRERKRGKVNSIEIKKYPKLQAKLQVGVPRIDQISAFPY